MNAPGGYGPARAGELAPAADAIEPLLRLLHLVSPALPVGAYAYSQGLEYAVQAAWVHDEAGAGDWLLGLAWRGLGSLDLPVLLRLHGAWTARERAAALRWNERLLAARETREARAEDLHLGRALARILADLGQDEARELAGAPLAFATAFALAGAHWNIGARALLGGYLWSWAENQVLAAVKLVPLGQSAGQRLLHRLIGEMPALLERSLALPDERIGSATVSQVLASALHETQYTRLFRS